MEWLRITEVIFIVIVPLLVWWLNQKTQEMKEERKELLKNINQTINNRALLLERKLSTCENAISNIHELLKHRREVAQLKYSILKDKIEDLERFASNKHGYSIRHNRNTNQSSFTTMTGNNDDEIETEIF